MKVWVLLCLALLSSLSFADYNANHKSELSAVVTYAAGDYIYVKLKNPPAVTSCDKTYFVISETVPESRRQMMLSRLLMAYASKEVVNIGYDEGSGDCIHGYVRIHRVG